MARGCLTRDDVYESRVLIAVAQACWRKDEPSYSWHVFDWLCYRQRLKHPLVRRSDCVINIDGTVT